MFKKIVSLIANRSGRATIWRRDRGQTTKTAQRFSNFIVTGDRPNVNGNSQILELSGDLPFKYKMTGRNIGKIANKFDYHEIIAYNNVQQYLIASGNTYFADMEFQDLYRLQFDIETTTKRAGYISNPEYDEIYMITVSDTKGYEEVITGSEAEIIQRLIEIILEKDPDVIENHNIFGFDLPFLCKRAKTHGIPLNLGRDGSTVWSYDDSVKIGGKSEKFTRYCINGREVIDTMFMTRRHIHELRSRGYGLKNTAKYLGVASEDRTYIAGDEIWNTWKDNPDKVEKYAIDDVKEARAISDELLPIDFELTKIFPDKLEKVATAGTATLIDMLLVSEYLNAGHSIPKATIKKQKYAGGLTEIYRKGVLYNIVKADVSSMYPSIMLTHRIKPDHDPLNIFQTKLQSLTNQRHKAKSELQSLNEDNRKYKATDAYQQALKLIINSFYGLLGTGYSSFHFNSPSGAKKVTAIGRDILKEMLKAGEQLDGIPVEADTDGIYFAGIGKDKAVEFVDGINKQLDREGITIDFDGYWKSMYSYGKKNYTLIDSEGNLTLKGIFNQGDEEQFISETKAKILNHLFNGEMDAIKRIYVDTLEKIRDGKMGIDDIAKSQQLGKDLDKYGNNTTASHIQALFNADITDAKQGYQVEYYRDVDGWKLANEFDGEYDTRHYLNRFEHTIKRTFDSAFTDTDNDFLFSDTLLDLNFDSIETQSTEIEDDPVIVNDIEATAWLELSYGNKSEDMPDRWNWTSIDDLDGIIDFVEKYDYLDVHRSNIAYWSDEPPVTAKLSRHKQVGAFFLEIEGKEYDHDLEGNLIIDDRNNVAVECCRKIVDHLIDLGVDKKDIVVYFNGGKSLYVFIPMDYITDEPRFRLQEIYQKITEDLIIPELPEKYQSLIDTQIYQFKHSLRLLDTKHHKGRFGYNIKLNDLYRGKWEQLTSRKVTQAKVEATFTDSQLPPEDDTKIIKDFAKIAKKVENSPQTASDKKRTSKAKAYRKHVKRLEYILENDKDYLTPCVSNLAKAIVKKESIGFGGRNKFISEMLILLRAQGYSNREIDDNICQVFIENGDPNRYGILEADDRENPNPCGYRLQQNYFDIEKLETFDPSCKTCQEFCNPAKCYRHKEFKTREDTTDYSIFKNKGRKRTAEAVQDLDFQEVKITAIDASLGSGKTYQVCKKAVELSNQNDALSIIFTHSHDASQEVCDNVKRMDLEGGVCVNMRGKTKKTALTCYTEYQNCQSCKYQGKLFSSDKETREQARQQLLRLCSGQVVDLEKAQQLADAFDCCPFVIMRALAITMQKGIVVCHHNYLASTRFHTILNEISSNFFFVDEADQMITNLISRYQDKMTVAKTRSNLQHTYRKSCGNQCDKCKLHFSDIWSRGLNPRQHIKTEEENEIQDPQNFIETLKKAVILTGETDIDALNMIFDFDALETNIERLEKILTMIDDTDCTPYESITGLEKKLINSEKDFIEVDKIFEGMTTYDGKTIFPDENIVSVAVEKPIDTEAAFQMIFSPDPDEEVSNELKTKITELSYYTLLTKQERAQIQGTSIESAVKILIAFANLCIKGKDKIGLYFETRRVDEDDTIPNHRQNLRSCGLSLRVFDQNGFGEVTDKMRRSKTLLLSGTFIDHDKLATSLMLQPHELNYIDVTEPMHDRFMIIHSGAKGQKTDGVKISNMGNTHVMRIWRRVDELLEDARILDFKKNTTQGNIFFNAVNDDKENNNNFRVENHCRAKKEIADWCSAEAKARGTHTRSLLAIDKLRSSRARAVNRGLFNVCAVHGNGYVNWYDFLPYVQKIRDTVDHEIELDDLFEYDRRKVVAQAITRAPRDENRTAGIYIGDMPYRDYPEYLKPCVVLIDEIIGELKDARPEDFTGTIDDQIEVTAQVIAGFIKGDVTHDDQSAIFDKIDFQGEYEGGKREGRKQQVDYSGLNEVEKYAVMSFIDKFKDGTDNTKTIDGIIDRVKHIQSCIDGKGYLDRSKDRKGNSSDWSNLIQHLTKIGYLESEKIDTGGRRKKVVYRKTDRKHSDNQALKNERIVEKS